MKSEAEPCSVYAPPVSAEPQPFDTVRANASSAFKRALLLRFRRSGEQPGGQRADALRPPERGRPPHSAADLTPEFLGHLSESQRICPCSGNDQDILGRGYIRLTRAKKLA